MIVLSLDLSYCIPHLIVLQYNSLDFPVYYVHARPKPIGNFKKMFDDKQWREPLRIWTTEVNANCNSNLIFLAFPTNKDISDLDSNELTGTFLLIASLVYEITYYLKT